MILGYNKLAEMSGFFCHVSNISATVSAKITDVNVIDTVTCP